MRTDQLRAANAAGFLPPLTLCTNDPEQVRRFLRAAACREVMSRLGIVFGAFDLVVTPEGVFLEVNEMGAFLWLEEKLPELGLLDTFCEFLRQGRMDFQPSRPSERVQLAQLHDEVGRQVEEAHLKGTPHASVAKSAPLEGHRQACS